MVALLQRSLFAGNATTINDECMITIVTARNDSCVSSLCLLQMYRLKSDTVENFTLQSRIDVLNNRINHARRQFSRTIRELMLEMMFCFFKFLGLGEWGDLGIGRVIPVDRTSNPSGINRRAGTIFQQEGVQEHDALIITPPLKIVLIANAT